MVTRKSRKLTEIVEGKLYLGYARPMERLRREGMRSVLNFAKRTYDGQRRNFPLTDGREDPQRLLKAAERIHVRLQRGQYPLYVHCAAGVSRSPTVVAVYLWKFAKKFRTFDEAFKHVRRLHKTTGPNRRILESAREIR